MADRRALWGWDLDEFPVEPTDEDARYETHDDGAVAVRDSHTAHDPITEPIPLTADGPGAAPEGNLADVMAAADPPQAAVKAGAWEVPPPTSYARPFIERPAGTPIATLTFKPARTPWYRTNAALIALLAMAAAALLLAIVPMVLRGESAGSEESTDIAPAPLSSAAPTSSPSSPTGAPPTLTSAPAAAPPPPTAPPPPAPVQDNRPAYTPSYSPRNSFPPQSNKPEVGVTRAPISVAPEIRGPIDNPATRNRNGDNGGW